MYGTTFHGIDSYMDINELNNSDLQHFLQTSNFMDYFPRAIIEHSENETDVRTRRTRWTVNRDVPVAAANAATLVPEFRYT